MSITACFFPATCARMVAIAPSDSLIIFACVVEESPLCCERGEGREGVRA